MRRPILAALAALAGLTLSVVAAGSPSTAADPTPGPRPPAVGEAWALRALAAARSALGESRSAQRRTTAARPDATLALRDLFRALPHLDATDRRTAQALLARPTDGAADPNGDGYTVPARRRCGDHLCVHWVSSTADAPPSRAWVGTNLRQMERVWRAEVGGMGYRAPLSDGRRGGNGKLDVYLKEIGSEGIYGYCAPERRARRNKWLASGYCVLDDDFARRQYGAPPRASLRVTGAHEFFHAVQYAYDYAEDPWLMEATATWMEERVADDVDDNRQYLRYGQLGAPGQPLDEFDRYGFNQYGNWAFFEFLSSRFGRDVVRSIWTRAGEYRGAGHQYSTRAVEGVLARHGGWRRVYGRFVAGNVVPGRTYAEGTAWPAAPPARRWTLSRDRRTNARTLRTDHMASRNVRIRPGAGLTDRRWRLTVSVDGPVAVTGPRASVVIRTVDHRVRTLPVRLGDDGVGRRTIRFSSRNVLSATVVLANASTRFSCWHQTTWSCQGRARDNGLGFRLGARLYHARLAG